MTDEEPRTRWTCPACGNFKMMAERPRACEGKIGSIHPPEEFVDEARERSARAFRRASDIAQRRVGWLWRPYVPRRVVTGFGGNGGVGKSTVTCAWAAAVTRGETLPGGWAPIGGEPSNVLMMSTEDDLDAVLVPRLRVAGADTDRVILMDVRVDDRLAVLDDHTFESIDEQVRLHRPRLVVLDPIVAFMGPERDMNRANEIRPMIQRLGAIAERHDCAVVVIGHLNKNEGASAGNRFSGSVDFRNAFRSLLLAGRVDEEPERGCAVFHNKCNYAPEAGPLGYATVSDPGEDVARAEWRTTDLTEAEVFSGKPPKTSRIKMAADVVREVLRGAPGAAAPSSWLTGIIEQVFPNASNGALDKIRKAVPVVSQRSGDGRRPGGSQTWPSTVTGERGDYGMTRVAFQQAGK